MPKLISVLVLLTITALSGSPVSAGDTERQVVPEPEVVAEVDLARYMGRYYEIALIPNSFQSACAGGTTATYTLREDGDVDVVNSCYDKDGELIVAHGIAWLPDGAEPAKLKVSFIPFGLKIFGGAYWIIMLAEDYSFAVIGHPQRKYGWILSREKELPATTLELIKEQLRLSGYRFEDFQMTVQQNYPPPAE